MTQYEVIRDVLPPREETIFGCPACPNIDKLSADIAFLGIPYEQGTGVGTYSGKKWGPKALRDTRRVFAYESPSGWFDIDTGEWQLRGVTMADCGDVNILPAEGANVDKMTNCDRVTEVLRKILNRGAFPVVLAGDHTSAFPVVRALDKHPLDIVQFDAHLDFRERGAKINDSDCMKRCSELPFVHHITQIGWNGYSNHFTKWGKKEIDEAVAYGVDIVTIKRLRQMGVSQVVESIPQAENIYVTIDIDCMDGAVAPATNPMTPGGMTFLEIQQTLVGIPKRGKVVGFDVNGLLPAREPSGRTAMVVLALILDFLAAIFPSVGR